ncbi:MAG: HAD family hydrolase [Anaeroplasma sp.]
MKKVFLFDLDSTLLQMNQDLFLQEYFLLVSKYAQSLGFNPNEFMTLFQNGAYSVIKNDGLRTNEEVFWNVIKTKYTNVEEIKKQFDRFYRTEFLKLETIVKKTDIPNMIIKFLRERGYMIILATNPVFPKICTYARIKWAGLDINDFIDITTYENSTYCKPNHLYFEELLNRNNVKPSDCIMVGNDIDDDFSDLPKEISKILITDYLINRNNKIISMPAYTLEEYFNYIKENL